VYILCSSKKGTLYIGVTNNLRLRIWQHKTKSIPGFTAKYNINRLVHIEEFQNVNEALHREKCIKKWNRQWKLRLIEENNPEWIDFYDTIV
jgi:putative endonuclease